MQNQKNSTAKIASVWFSAAVFACLIAFASVGVAKAQQGGGDKDKGEAEGANVAPPAEVHGSAEENGQGRDENRGRGEGRGDVEGRGDNNDRRDGRGGPPWRFSLDANDLTEEQIDTLMQIIEAMFPDRFEQFVELREKEPERLRHFLSRIAQSNREVPHLMFLSRVDPEMYGLNRLHLGARFRKYSVEKSLRRAKEEKPVNEELVTQLTGQARDVIAEKKNAEFQIRRLTLDRAMARLRELMNVLEDDIATVDTLAEDELAELVRRAEAGERTPRPDELPSEFFAPGSGPSGPSGQGGPNGGRRGGDGGNNGGERRGGGGSGDRSRGD